MLLHLDPLGGIAGDMFVAALLDAHPEWTGGLLASVAAVLPRGWTASLQSATDHGLSGQRFQVSAGDADSPPSGSLDAIRAHLQASALAEPVRQHAIGLFEVLADAEAAVHGIDREAVHFHEVADWDSLADMVAAAHLIQQLDKAHWSVGPLPLGAGTVSTRHGQLPVPAPATVRLLQGMAVIDDGIPGERVTPTGAAILRYLAPQARAGQGGVMRRCGQGFGTRQLPDRANLLRVLVLESATAESDTVAVVSFEVDDQSGEDLALALDRLRALSGVLDIQQIPALGKKGRLSTHIQLLCQPGVLAGVRRHCLMETTTLGLRWRLEQRETLPRRAINFEGTRVKLATRPDGALTAKVEAEDLRAIPDHATRARQRRRVETTVLSREEDNHNDDAHDNICDNPGDL